MAFSIVSVQRPPGRVLRRREPGGRQLRMCHLALACRIAVDVPMRTRSLPFKRAPALVEIGRLLEMETIATSGPSLYAEFAERCRKAAEEDSVRARALRWRDVSFEERARTGIGLMRLADKALKSRPEPYRRPPLARRIQPIRRD